MFRNYPAVQVGSGGWGQEGGARRVGRGAAELDARSVSSTGLKATFKFTVLSLHVRTMHAGQRLEAVAAGIPHQLQVGDGGGMYIAITIEVQLRILDSTLLLALIIHACSVPTPRLTPALQLCVHQVSTP